MVDPSKIEVVVASEEHIKYVDEILDTINRAAKVRGTGIAKRSPEYVKQKMLERKAVVALCEGEFAGFSYIECWSNKEFVANSGLIVADKYRGIGLATRIKRRIFRLSREMFPDAKIFSLTTGAAVMKMNFELGYRLLHLTSSPPIRLSGADVKVASISTYCSVTEDTSVCVPDCCMTQRKHSIIVTTMSRASDP